MKRKPKPLLRQKAPPRVVRDVRKRLEQLISDFQYERKHRDKLWEKFAELSERVQEAEVQININTRLLTYLCIEELGMNTLRIKKLLKRIEKETQEEQQIIMLEELFRKKSRPRGERRGLDERFDEK